MKTMYDLEAHGHLKIERIDCTGNVVDVPVDVDNMIMTPARLSMAELFANMYDNKWAHRFMFGTAGHKDNNVYTPKDSATGFTKIRDRMFSQASLVTYGWGQVVEYLNKFDIVKIAKDDGEVVLWEYSGEDRTNEILVEDDIKKSQYWRIIESEPYYISIDFTLPRTNNPPEGTTNTEPDSLYDVQVTQQDTSVTFVIQIPMDCGNEQHVNDPDYVIPTTVFTEASLWVNDRIFSLKTFQGVTKDNSIKLRVTWTITF